MTKIKVRSHNGSAGVYASRNLRAGEHVMDVDGEESEQPSRYSIQVGMTLHVHPTDAAWKFLNHSCRPNLVYVAEPRRFIATRAIAAGEELFFNYLTTEWSMSDPFDCRCGMPECRGRIEGFGHLDHAVQMGMLEEVAPHIRAIFEEAGSPIAEADASNKGGGAG